MADDPMPTPDPTPPPSGGRQPHDLIPDVAVVVTAYNRADFLPQTLQSLVHQDFGGWFEVLVVDDASETDIYPAVQPFLERYKHAVGHVNVAYIRHEMNQGLAEARNTGVRHTTAPLIAFVDDDDVCEPAKLRRQVEAFAADPQVGLVHTSFRYIDKDGKFCDEGPQRLNNPCVGRCVDVLLNELLVVSSTVMVRRDALERIAAAEPHGKPYDPKWVRSQDYDMALRMARLYPFAYVAEPLLRYRLHGGNIAISEGSMKKAYGYHCRVQMDFVARYGHEMGIDDAEARRRAANFLFNRAESHFWQRKFDMARQLCDLADELGVRDGRFASVERRASRPLWVYKVKDKVDQLIGRGR
jgi:glycosyltransferase involved in cell wall biosynthesis